MKDRGLTFWLMLASLVCGCRQSVDGEKPGAVGQSAPSSGLVAVTCKPTFELVLEAEIRVADQEGNRRDAFKEWLILDDGRKQYRIWWGTPPLSHGPVLLRSDQTYTFSVATILRQDVSISKVVRIVEGNKVIYEAPQQPAVPDN